MYSTASICKIIEIAFLSLFSKYLSEKIGSRSTQLEDLLTYPCKWSALPGQRGRPNYLNSSRLFTCYMRKCICCSICLSICIEMYLSICVMRTKMHRPPFMLTSADCSSKAPFPKTRSAFVASLQESSEQVKYFLTDL